MSKLKKIERKLEKLKKRHFKELCKELAKKGYVLDGVISQENSEDTAGNPVRLITVRLRRDL